MCNSKRQHETDTLSMMFSYNDKRQHGKHDISRAPGVQIIRGFVPCSWEERVLKAVGIETYHWVDGCTDCVRRFARLMVYHSRNPHCLCFKIKQQRIVLSKVQPMQTKLTPYCLLALVEVLPKADLLGKLDGLFQRLGSFLFAITIGPGPSGSEFFLWDG